jgi:hypothetical protein
MVEMRMIPFSETSLKAPSSWLTTAAERVVP